MGRAPGTAVTEEGHVLIFGESNGAEVGTAGWVTAASAHGGRSSVYKSGRRKFTDLRMLIPLAPISKAFNVQLNNCSLSVLISSSETRELCVL